MATVGAYEVLGELGRGGMGVVLKARAPSGEVVAVKVLLRPEARTAFERFDRERRVLSSLRAEDGFVPLLDAGDSPRGPFIVMPFEPGGTLADRLHRGPLGIAETIDLGRALASALGRAHALGIVHRDLKPANVLFDATSRPLLADLGLAKHFRAEPGTDRSASLSKTGAFLGTPGYLAPEQMYDAKTAGPEADVFALGAVLYECLAGAPAFPGSNVLEVLAHNERAEHTPLASVRSDVPAWLAAAIERALAAEARDRFPDGQAFARALVEPARWPAFVRPLVESVARLSRREKVFRVLWLLVIAYYCQQAFWPRAAPSALPPTPAATPAPSPSAPPARPSPSPEAEATPATGTSELASSFSGSVPAGDLCAGFRKTRRTKLAWVWGSYEWKQAATIYAVAISPDGTRGLTGGEDRAVRLWDLETGRELARAPGAGETFNWVDGVVLSPDGTRALSTINGTASLWKVGGGLSLVEAKPLREGTRSVAFLPNGKQALVGSGSGVVLWDLATGGTRAFEIGQIVRATALSDRDALVATTNQGERLVYLDLASGKTIAFGGPTTLFAAGSGDLVLAADEKRARLFTLDRTAGSVHETISWDLGVRLGDVAVSEDRRVGLVCGDDATVHVLDLEHLEPGPVLADERCIGSPIMRVAVTPDGRSAIASSGSVLRRWAVGSGQLVSRYIVGIAGPVRCVAFTPAGETLLVGGQDGYVFRLDATKGQPDREGVCCHEPVASVGGDGARDMRFTQDGKLGVTVHDRRRPVHDTHATAVAFLASGTVVLRNASSFLVVALTPEGDPVEVAKRKTGEDAVRVPVVAIAVTPDARYLIETSRFDPARREELTTELELLDLADGSLRPFGSPRGSAIRNEAFKLSADGKLLFEANGAGIWVWAVPGGTLERTFEGPEPGVCALAPSPDGKRLLVGREDGTISLREALGGEELDRIDLASSADVVQSLAFSPDSRSFVVGTRRGVVLRFDIQD